MPVVAISEITPDPRDDSILEFQLDSPVVNETAEVYAIRFAGHVVGSPRRPVAISVEAPGADPRLLPFGVARPDLEERYPEISWAISNSGFNSSVSALRYPPEFELQLAVLYTDGGRAPLARVVGRHDYPRSESGGLDPIMITTLGRTGSTWVTQLLGGHPQIIVYPPFRHEVRLASYWLDIFLTLTEPASYLQSVQALVSGDSLWWTGQGRRSDEEIDDQEMLTWLGRNQVDRLATVCKQRIDSFYETIARREDGKQPVYFAEKALPHLGGQIAALEALYPRLREIVLVRDFRDMTSSIFAYNTKQGFPYFNRHLATDDEDYVRNYLGPDVMKLLEAWEKRADRAHLLRYEDLVLKPRSTLTSLLDYLGLDSGDAAIDAMLAGDQRTFEEGQQDHATSNTAEESIGRWRSDLPDTVAAACEDAFEPALSQFGYRV